jgi:peroxiredoxin
MKKGILALMALLCLNFAEAYQITNLVENIGDYKIVYKEGIQYAIVDNQELLLQKTELFQNGPEAYDFYVIKADGEKFSLTEAWSKKMIAEGKLVLKSNNHPASKPFEKWISPKTGKKYKWYSVLKTPEGRILTREEFNSFKGNFKWGKKISGGPDAMDTTIIHPPTAQMKKIEADRIEKFHKAVGKPVPELTFTDIKGKHYTKADLIGKVVVINFWFTSCGPCIKEMPELNDLVNKYKSEDDIIFLAFATDSKIRIDKFLAKREFDYRIVSDAKTIAEEDFNVLYYPSHFIVDKQGITQFAFEGYEDNLIEEIDHKINLLLK